MSGDLSDGLLWYAVFLFSTVCHEAAHAWTAFKLGDDTAQRGGQVSLNPVPHIRREFVGMVVVPLLAWFTAGWMMGWASAPYNQAWARAYPRRAGLMALAGPAANLGLMLSAALLIRVGLEWRVFDVPFALSPMHITDAMQAGAFAWAAKALSVIFSLNLLLCVFNLLPIPPLDGSSVPLLLLPAQAAARYFDVMSSPVLRVIGLLLILRGLGGFFPDLLRWAGGLLYPHVPFN
jgi:Zn-dependent protease